MRANARTRERGASRIRITTDNERAPAEIEMLFTVGNE